MDDLTQKLRQSESLTAYLRSAIDEKDEKLARAEHSLESLRSTQIAEISLLQKNFYSQFTALTSEIESQKLENVNLTEEIASLLLFRRENELLKVQVSSLRDEILTLRKSHKVAIQQTRDEVTQIRAGLAAEFQLQLENSIENNVEKELMKLPEKARMALAEKEVLRLQLKSQDEEIWKNVEKGMKMEKKGAEMQIEFELLKAENGMLGARSVGLKKKLGEVEGKLKGAEKRVQEMQDELDVLREWKGEYLAWKGKVAGEEKEAEGVKRQLQHALLGLKRVCSRFKLDFGQFYKDPLEEVKLKEKLPSIVTQRGRFVVPDI